MILSVFPCSYAEQTQNINTANMYINESELIRHMGKEMYGINCEWSVGFNDSYFIKDGNQNVVLNPRFGEAFKDIMVAARQAGTSSQKMKWKDAIGPFETRNQQTIWEKTGVVYLGIVEWLKQIYSANPNTKITYTVNLDSDTLENLADIVEFLIGDGTVNYNGGENWALKRKELGIENPVDVYTWEIGNEMDLLNWTVEEYIAYVKQVIPIIKAIDPNAKIACHASTNVPKGREEDYAWHRAVLRELGSQMDYLIVHYYYNPNNVSYGDRILENVETDIVEITGSGRIKIYLSEHSPWPFSLTYDKENPFDYTVPHTIWGATAQSEFYLRTFMRPWVSAMNCHSIHSAAWCIQYVDDDGNYHITPTGEIMKTFIKYGVGDVLYSNLNTFELRSASEIGIAGGVIRDGNGNVNILLTNRSETAPVQVNFKFSDGIYRIKHIRQVHGDVKEADDWYRKGSTWEYNNSNTVTVSDYDAEDAEPLESYTFEPLSLYALQLEKIGEADRNFISSENFESYNLVAKNTSNDLTVSYTGKEDKTLPGNAGYIINAPGGSFFTSKNEVYEGNAAENLITYAKTGAGTAKAVLGGLNNGWKGRYSDPMTDINGNGGADPSLQYSKRRLAVVEDNGNQVLKFKPSSNPYVKPDTWSDYCYDGLDLTESTLWESEVKINNINADGSFLLGMGSGALGAIEPFVALKGLNNNNYLGGRTAVKDLIAFKADGIYLNAEKKADIELGKTYRARVEFYSDLNTYKIIISDKESGAVVAQTAEVECDLEYTANMNVYYTARTQKSAEKDTDVYIDNIILKNELFGENEIISNENFSAYNLNAVLSQNKQYSIEGYEGAKAPAWRIINAAGGNVYTEKSQVYEGNAAENIITYAKLDENTVKIVPGGLNNGWRGIYSHPARDPEEKNGGAAGNHTVKNNRLGVAQDGENQFLKLNPAKNSYVATWGSYAYENLDLTEATYWESNIKIENVALGGSFIMGFGKGNIASTVLFENPNYVAGRTDMVSIAEFSSDNKITVNNHELMSYENGKVYNVTVAFIPRNSKYKLTIKDAESGIVLAQTDKLSCGSSLSDNMNIYYTANNAKGSASETCVFIDDISIIKASRAQYASGNMITALNHLNSNGVFSIAFEAVNENPEFKQGKFITAVYEKATKRLIACSDMKSWDAERQPGIVTSISIRGLENFNKNDYYAKIMVWDSTMRPFFKEARY